MKLLQLLVLLYASTTGASGDGAADIGDTPTYEPTTDSTGDSNFPTEMPTPDEPLPTYTPTMMPTVADAAAVSQTATAISEAVVPTMYPTYNPTTSPIANTATQAQATSSEPTFSPTTDDDESYSPTKSPTDYPTYIPTIMPAATNNVPTVYDGGELAIISKNSDIDTAENAAALSQSQLEESPNKPSRFFLGILAVSMLIFVAYGFGVYRRRRSYVREEIPTDEVVQQNESNENLNYRDSVDAKDLELV